MVNYMKRVLCTVLSGALLIGLCGCRGNDNNLSSSEIVEIVYEEETIYEGDNVSSDTTDGTISSTPDNSSSKGSTSDVAHTSGSDTSSTNSESAENNFKLNDSQVLEKIKLNGRTQKTDEGIVLNFAASAIEFNTDSSSALLEIKADAGVYYSIFVDGELKTERTLTEPGTNYIVLARGLSDGVHNIKFVRATECRNGNYLTASNILLDDGKSLLSKDANSDILIEFLGDSMSSGYGNLTTANTGAGDLKYQDSLKAYPYLIAQKLGFDYRIVSLSGIALKERTGYPTFYDFYYLENYFKDKTQKYTSSNPQDVDIVVVNLGTNDTSAKLYNPEDSDSIEEYANLYAELITKIGYRTDTKIVFISGVMWCHQQKSAYISAKKILNGQGYDKVYYYDIPTYNSGGEGHPSTKDHQTVADAIIAFFKSSKII